MTETVKVFDIERFAIKDGPGIRTVVFMQGCPLHCPWCSNPESGPAGSVLRYYEGKCMHCGACAAVCPVSAVTFKDGVVHIDRAACTLCGSCVETCPGAALKLSPRQYECKDVVGILLRDKDYYEHSGGGVTFSGGEALMQPEALLAMLKMCKAEGLHTAVETTANVSYDKISEIEPYTDLFLIDLKHTDSVKLHRTTGANPELVLGNIRSLVATAARKIRLRMPCIPGFNMEKGHFEKAFSFAAENGIKGIDLIPYHCLGTGKYKQLGREYRYGENEPLDRKALEPFAAIGISMGLDVKII